jgi:predicted CopG family antitoxin
MSESISVSDDLKTRLNRIMKPGESYEDVINMLLEEHQEEKSLCEGWATRAKEAIEEYQRGETLTEAEIMRKYGVT